MKTLALIFALIISASSFARECEPLKGAKRTKYAKMGCAKIASVYGGYLSVDQELCVKKSKISLCENDPRYGTYIFGDFPYTDTREALNCNMGVVDDKISGIDCGDE